MAEDGQERAYLRRGTDAAWYQGWDITEERRGFFRRTALESRDAKLAAEAGLGPDALHEINIPTLDPAKLMPRLSHNRLRSLSLFSGGGGLDLGFDLAGFEHVASHDVLVAGCRTIKLNRPEWKVHEGDDGDVTRVDWRSYRGTVDVLHGGPPCQPFSTAGRQWGHLDPRDMVPQFVRAVKETSPQAFVMENVPALFTAKFEAYLRSQFFAPLEDAYHMRTFELAADAFGLPQVRRRGIVVGFRSPDATELFSPPLRTHHSSHLDGSRGHKQEQLLEVVAPTAPVMGVREALGLPDIGFDALAPTLRSTLTGPRHTTSINSSTAAARMWHALKIWPNGVAPDRESAQRFVARNGHFRLSVPDCALIQGFPEDWAFFGAVYLALGQIGNSVAPPVAYRLAVGVSEALTAANS